MEGLLSSMELGFGLILRELSEVLVSLPPDGLSAQLMLQSLQWETLLSLPVLTSLLAVLFGCRLTHSVRSRLYQRRGKQPAERLAAQVEMKCQLIDRLFMGRQECARVETALKNAGREKEPANIPGLAAAYRHLVSVNLSSRKEVTCVIEELRKERFPAVDSSRDGGDAESAGVPGGGHHKQHIARGCSHRAGRPCAKPCWSLSQEWALVLKPRCALPSHPGLPSCRAACTHPVRSPPALP